jgi:hypothetical protein
MAVEKISPQVHARVDLLFWRRWRGSLSAVSLRDRLAEYRPDF